VGYPTNSIRTPSAHALRERFDAVAPLTVGLEEELMLLDAETLDLLPRAVDVIARTEGDERFKLELPAAQLEIVLPPTSTVAESASALAAARRELTIAANGLGVLAAAGAHPFADPVGALNGGPRYDLMADEYGEVARCQLVCALQVHVAVGGHERTLAVYNALRSHLPELAALAANAPFYAGRDTGLASVRPKVCDLLPRQGVPPAIASWEDYAEALRWGAAAGRLPEPRLWWWELRPHPLYGTLEVRVPDAQATVAGAAGVCAVVQALVGWLGDRHEAGELPAPDPSWRIAENRWAACRHGLDAELADLSTGELRPARELLAARLDELAATAVALGCAAELDHARRLLAANGAECQRRAAAEGGGARAAARWLVDAYAPSVAPVGAVDG
jgi:glutamate---cysteine ligase / carboxylate-amine ligase